jgi:endonuclease/exonuclease/phosphatase family metal-dependent hydrolase
MGAGFHSNMRGNTKAARIAGSSVLAAALLLTQAGMTSAGRDGSLPYICREAASLAVAHPIAPSPGGRGLRVATYNIHSGLGSAFSLGKSRAEVEQNLEEIAADIVAATPVGDPVEVVALNEVDFGSRRSAWIDEADFLAAELRERTGQSYDVVRGQTWERRAPGREVRFGNALLVRLPVVSASSCLFSSGTCDVSRTHDDLPRLKPAGLRGLFTEERGVIKATVLAATGPVDLVVTHLDAFSAEAREAQAMHLLHRFVDPSHTTVLLGDLNAVTTSLTGRRRFFREERTLDILTSSTLADARTSNAAMHELRSEDRWATYPAASPLWPLDAVLASADLMPAEVTVIGTTASDHRGLAARLIPLEDAGQLARSRERHELLRSAQLERIRSCDLVTDEARARRGWLVEKTGFAALGAPAS